MRRVHVGQVRPGVQAADAAQARHLRTVLRVKAGDRVEVFDAAGRTALAMVAATEPDVLLDVDPVAAGAGGPPTLVVAAAVPKGDRADWMVEKLSELGVSRFVPLRTARSVVHPEGSEKIKRWERIAVEAAKQSRRAGVMAVGSLAELSVLLNEADPSATLHLSTRPDALPLPTAASDVAIRTLLIGPEGGWTAEEEGAFAARGLTGVSLGPTILRIETAAVLAAGLTALLRAPQPRSETDR